jgi:hypothetical protein
MRRQNILAAKMQSGEEEVVSEALSPERLGAAAQAAAADHKITLQLRHNCKNLPSSVTFHFEQAADNEKTPYDADGDLLPPRRRKRRRPHAVLQEDNFDIHLQVCGKSSGFLCGLQVWSASLLLTEFVVSRVDTFCGQVIVELGMHEQPRSHDYILR